MNPVCAVKNISMRVTALIGIDGGGSRIRAVAVESNAALIATVSLRFPANVLSSEEKSFYETLNAVFTALQTYLSTQSLEKSAIVAGFAGAGRPSEQNALLSLFSKIGFRNNITILSDLEIALEGAFPEGEGIVLVAGTGSAAIGRDASGVIQRCGGYGYILGDEGSGYDIGRKAISYAIQNTDGLLPETHLTAELCSCFSVHSVTDIIPLVNSGKLKPADISAFAPTVFSLAREGDALALKIITEAGTSLGILVQGLVKRLKFSSFPISLCLVGSIFKDKELILPYLFSNLPGDTILIVEPEFPPVIGAVIRAFRTSNIPVTDRIKSELKKILVPV